MIAEYPLIPDEAFLYLPDSTKLAIIIDDHIYQRRDGQKKHRVIFGGGIPFNHEQITKINLLRTYIAQEDGLNYLNGFPDDFLLRFLQACSFNNKDCLEALKSYYGWQKKTVPIQLSQNTLKLLKLGTMYLCGRDCYYRPLIVVDVKKILDLQIKAQLLLECLGYYFQYIIENCLIEGQVETWNTIIDLGDCSVFSLGGTLVQIIKHLSSIFRARIHHSYLLNCPRAMKMLWGMVKNVLNQDQIRKISLSDKKILKTQNFNTINPHQIQIKYGGKRSDLRNYWPIEINPYQIAVSNEQVRLIKLDDYDRLFTQGELKQRKIKKQFIKKFKILKKLSVGLEEDKITEKNDENEEELNQYQEVMYPLQIQVQKIQVLYQMFSYDQLFNS